MIRQKYLFFKQEEDGYSALTARSNALLDHVVNTSIGIAREITPNLYQSLHYPAQVSYMYSSNRYLLHGTMFKDQMEGTAALKINKLILVSNWISTRAAFVDSNLYAFYNRNNYYFEASCSSTQIGGISILTKRGNWSAGTEAFITAKEKSGGLSFGCLV
jgi:hypothetical protein